MVPELLTSSKTLLLHLGPPSLLPVPTGLNLMSHNSNLSIFQYSNFHLSIFEGLCYVPSSTSASNPLPTTSLCRALACASHLAKVRFDETNSHQKLEDGPFVSTSSPFPMPLLTICAFELFPQFNLFVSQWAGNDIPPGERTRGDGGNH